MISRVRIAAALLALVVGLALGLPMSAAPAAATTADDESSLFALTNQSRADNGLDPLAYDAAASQVARAWAQTMAGAGTLMHNPALVDQISTSVTNQWTRIGENVGYGPSTGVLETAFMNSAPHRANILGDYNRAGVGAARDANGTLWVVVDFVKGPPLATGTPFGALDSAGWVSGGVHLTGWAIDPDTTGPVQVHVYSDGKFAGLSTANVVRNDVGTAFPNSGAAHGYDFSLPLGEGAHQVCVYAINAAGGGTNPALGCRWVVVYGTPIGSFDGFAATVGGVVNYGWTIDPDTAAATDVHVYVDGVWANQGTANKPRYDVASAYPAYGANHGFNVYAPLSAGVHTICVYALNAAGPGTNPSTGCHALYWSGTPFGNLDGVTPSSGRVTVAGWAVDPDTVSSGTIHVYLDGVWDGAGAAQNTRQDIGSALPAWGASHGFQFSVPATSGQHTVCAYALNTAQGGSNGPIGCRSITVP